LIDKDVVEHIFERKCGRARKGTHYIYTCTREGRKGTQSLFYLPYPLKGHSTPSNSSVIGGEQFQQWRRIKI